MPAVLESVVPLPFTSKSLWPTFCMSKHPVTRSPSPIDMSSETLPSYLTNLHENPLPAQDINHTLPSSGWYGPNVPASDCSNETGYGPFSYDQPYVTPHTSSLSFSPPTEFSKSSEVSPGFPKSSTIATFSPVSEYSRVSEPPSHEYIRTSDGPGPGPIIPRSNDPSYMGFVHMDSVLPARPRSSPSTFSPTNPSGGPIDYSWTLSNPLGISAPNVHDSYYMNSTYPAVRARSPRLSGSSCMSPVTEIAAPQPRRMYPPIAPNPQGTPHRSSQTKRPRDEDDSAEPAKRRKRSESTNTVSADLGEEDRLLIQLKDEENMPWKDIAARFHSDLGKSYQIPALQMRLKRLRERMRVWTEADVRALRLAHEHWVQNKFDIISQKMLEHGAAEKWTARQCARKWAEIDPGPTPYTTYDHAAPTYSGYTMSPVEAGPFLPFLHIP